MIYVGIDPGMSVAIAVQDGDRTPRFFTVHGAHKGQSPNKWIDESLRLTVLRQKLHTRFGRIVKNSAVVVGVEHVSFGSVHRVAIMAKIELTIQEVLLGYIKYENIYMLAPTTIKKEVAGHGHASKEDLRDDLSKIYPGCKEILQEDLNYSDALGALHVAKTKNQQGT